MDGWYIDRELLTIRRVFNVLPMSSDPQRDTSLVTFRTGWLGPHGALEFAPPPDASPFVVGQDEVFQGADEAVQALEKVLEGALTGQGVPR